MQFSSKIAFFLFFFFSLQMTGLKVFASNKSDAIWASNQDHSEIHFEVPYMSVSSVSGRFDEFEAQGKFDDKTDSFHSVSVRILTSSLDSGNKLRDGHLKGSDFLKSNEHPYLTFFSTKISRTGPGKFRAIGDLAIKGIKRTAEVEFSMSKPLKDTWGYNNRFVKFKSVINRKDYHITWNKTLDGKQFLVGNNITFWGAFQMQPYQQKTPNSKHMIPDNEHMRRNDLERREAKMKEEESGFTKKLRSLINGNNF